MRAYGREVLIALDVFVNVALLRGKQGQTISGRVADARAAGRRIGCVMCRFLDWLFRENDHCSGAVQGDIARAERVLQDLKDVPPWTPPTNTNR